MAQTAEAIKARLDRAVKERQLAGGTKTSVLTGFINVVMMGLSVAAQDGATKAELLSHATMAVSSIDKLRADR